MDNLQETLSKEIQDIQDIKLKQEEMQNTITGKNSLEEPTAEYSRQNE